MITTDVLVVGGGPAGAAASIELRRAGRDVIVVDKATFPRDKCCGDGLTTGALRRLDHLGVDPSRVASWCEIADVHVQSPSGHAVTFPLPRDRTVHGAVARRAELDAALLDVARQAGADVREGCTAWSVTSTPSPAADAVITDVQGLGEVASRYVIAADGMWSPLRKALAAAEPSLSDPDGYLGEWHAFRQYFHGVSEQAASQLWVWFERDLLPGYAWSFPLAGGVANVGFGILRRPGEPTRSMKAQWDDLLGRPHLREFLGSSATPEAPHKAWPIPARIESTVVAALGGRVLFAGDAARATDPMTGEGIGQALETGMLAADAIVTAGWRRPEAAGASYTEVIRRTMAVDNRLAGALGRVLSSPAGADASVRIAGVSGWTRRNFARWLFEDYPRAVLATPRRWRPGMFTGAGAYPSYLPGPAPSEGGG